MAAPIISWYMSNNTTQVTNWAIGTVDAGTASSEFHVLVWNNRGGASAVSDMTNCKITTKDIAGTDTGELVTNTWIQAKVLTQAETTFTSVGGPVTHDIKAGGTAPANTISGVSNDGTVSNADVCFADIVLRAFPPANATAGHVDFLTRVSYSYV